MTEHPSTSSLSNADVRALRERRKARGETYEVLGFLFGIGTKSARDICVGATRLKAGGPLQPVRKPRRRLTAEEAKAVRDERKATGKTFAELAELYNVSQSQIQRVVTGGCHRNAGGPIEEPRRRSDSAPGTARPADIEGVRPHEIDPLTGCPWSVTTNPRWRGRRVDREEFAA